MWGNPTLFHQEKSTENSFRKINIDTINLEFFTPGKVYWKKLWVKITIDAINCEKLFGRSAKHQ